MPPTDLQPGAGEPARELMLFVCRANVCRSPALEFLTARSLESAGLGGAWDFASAGTAASEGQRMCRTAGAAIEEHPGGAGFSRRHRSRSLSADLVEQAALILVASHKERAGVARLAPSARERTFTMIEAALLVESAAQEGRWSDSGPLSLSSLVRVMHDGRGTTTHAAADRRAGRLLPRARRPPTLDIVDVHGGEVRNHVPVLDAIRRSSTQLSGSLARLATPEGG